MDDTARHAPPATGRMLFGLMNEAGIIAQLTRALLEKRSSAGITYPQFGVLNHLVRLGGTPSPLDLARAFQQPKTTMTHTLATLQKRGLIAMRPNPADGRSKLVHLTDAGRDAQHSVIEDLHASMSGLTDGIPEADLGTALGVLSQLRSRLDAARDEG